MPSASLMALAADLLGEDPLDERKRVRLPIAEAARSLSPGQVVAARSEDGDDVAVYATEAGDVYAVTDACPHDGGPLSSGFIEDDKLVCARHGWEFDTGTGACPSRRTGICPRRLR